MSKTIKLTIGERLAALKIFDAFKGGMTELSAILDDVKKLIVTEEEWTKAKLVKTPAGEGKENWKWEENDETTHKEVELDTNSIAYLARTIKSKSDNNEIVLTDVPLISLSKKIA
ncbi:MAG: hypothetical protein V4481_05065 [Patescibacteria group bacterium]